MEYSQEIAAALGAEFSADEVEFLPRSPNGGQALALPYIDARDVMRRLDAVVGPANWTFDFDVLDAQGKMVRGKLTVLGVTKCDAGEAGQEDEPLKSAVSDALKRCAVHHGIGRYLYYLPRVCAPFDPQKRRFIDKPRLDPAAVRRALALCGVAATPQAANGTGHPAPAAPAPAAASATPEPQDNNRRACTGEGCKASVSPAVARATTQQYGQALCSACTKKATPKSG